jgi:hypothetical protein
MSQYQCRFSRSGIIKLLRDPLILAMMKADGLDEDDVLRALDTVPYPQEGCTTRDIRDRLPDRLSSSG